MLCNKVVSTYYRKSMLVHILVPFVFTGWRLWKCWVTFFARWSFSVPMISCSVYICVSIRLPRPTRESSWVLVTPSSSRLWLKPLVSCVYTLNGNDCHIWSLLPHLYIQPASVDQKVLKQFFGVWKNWASGKKQ